MKSWAVPKGPSYDPSVKRLAMEVEDHPIDYNTFEGTIPKGQYGGGTVMLWDRGNVRARDGGGADAVRDGYERGDLKIVLHGQATDWRLGARAHATPGTRAQWLLIKHRDEYATSKVDVTEKKFITSVKTGRTMDEIAGGRSRVWNSNRAESQSSSDKEKATVGDGGPRSVSQVARSAKKKTAAKRSSTRSSKTAASKRAATKTRARPNAPA